MNHLFAPFTLNNLEIKNRIVMPPMVCFNWSDDEGFVSDEHIQHYKKRAKGGVGLIIVEATCIDKKGRLSESQLGIWSDDHIKGLQRLVQACKEYQAKMFIQIHHAGNKTSNHVIEKDKKIDVNQLHKEEIRSLQNQFVQAAKRAVKSGFDGIELHGAHGYLMNQFTSNVTNQRNDDYGGDIEKRFHFSEEVIDQIKAECPQLTIGYRMGGNDPTLDNGILIAKMLEQKGVDIIHVSAGISNDSKIEKPKDFPYGDIVYYGTQIKKHVKVPIIVVNGIRTPEQAAYLIENDLADFVAIGRGLLSDPYWANHAQLKVPVAACKACPRCFWFKASEECPNQNSEGKDS